ncbi:NAD-dependent epimerase/dehydratase family protein [Methanophagales archaeon]|nr:MAG: NAD-dependent epimerase/dehydratase family protein [Methanophagales archaeon]
MFICSGIAFNHESVPKNSPLILNLNGKIDVLPIEDLFRSEKHRYEGIQTKYIGAFVWDGESWTRILNGTCYKDTKKPLRLIQTREACYEATYDHICFDEKNNEIKTKDLKIGDKVFKVNFPRNENKLNLNKRLAKFIGYVVGDGFIDERGRITLTGTNKEELIKIAKLVIDQFGWEYRVNTSGPGGYENCKNNIWQLDINNDSHFGLWLKEHIYTRHSKEKKVPIFILNSDIETKKAFFEGYYLADGRKGGYEKYKYKGFTTKSATLCLGLILILKEISNQKVKCKCDYREGRRYYYVQLGTPFPINRIFSKKKLNEIIKITDTKSPDGWFFDIQTESQTFATGPNLFKIHNSPRRGMEFVTRKISHGVAQIAKGKQKYIELGNIKSKRDWGHAKDYVRAFWLMLQQKEPDDYVIATGKQHSIEDVLDIAFGHVGIDWRKGNYVRISEKYFRPADVTTLLGDATKAREKLGWVPEYTFEDLIKEMVEVDLKR